MDRPNVGVMECCRVCIQPSQGMMPIFSSFSLASKLMWVCQLKICEGDGLPSYICYSCNQRLNDAFQFKELCLTSDVQLRKYGVVEAAGETPAREDATRNGHRADDERRHPIEVKVEIQGDGRSDPDGDPGAEVRTENAASNGGGRPHTTKTFSCEICVVSFKKKSAFISHMRLHMTDEIDEAAAGGGCDDVAGEGDASGPPLDQNPFLCSICGGSYKFRESFVAHIKLHETRGANSGEAAVNNAAYSCAICHASFRVRQGFIAHVRQYHGRDDKDDKGFERTAAIKTEPEAFTCAVCGTGFERKAEFATHLATHAMEEGGGEREYTCAICDAVYSDRQGFVSHIRLHTVERRFPCADCRKRFTSHSDLTRHRRCHTGERPFVCRVCRKPFARQDHLAKHARTHTGARPYTCGECDQSFAEKKTLASHLRSHRGEKPYACATCGKTFARQTNYAAHVRSHAGEKMFECRRCDRAFLEKRGLSRHVGVHHAGEGAGGGS